MKLIFCERCCSVFSLAVAKEKSCDCGRCRGAYYLDASRAWTNGRGVNVVLGNGSLYQAINKLNQIPLDDPGDKDSYLERCSIEYAWVRPHSGPGNPRTQVKG